MLRASRMVWMLCFLALCCEAVRADSTGVGSSGGHSSEVKLTCNNRTYNPAKATCCGKQNLTEGLSENMSKCCGLQAYNPINEICCELIVHAKLSINTNCCSKVPYEENTHLCCGVKHKTVMTRLSSDHLCCVGSQYRGQYHKELECCCEDKYPLVQLKGIGGDCCEKNIEKGHPSPSVQSTNDNHGYFKNPKGGNLGEKETKCTNGNRIETYIKNDGFKCCGHYYYNPSLWLCCKNSLIPLYKRNWIFIFPGSNTCV